MPTQGVRGARSGPSRGDVMSGTRAGALLRESRKAKPTAAERMDRFLSNVEASADGCWLWTASVKDTGYAQFRVDGALVLGHRFAFEYFVGRIPEGLTLDHLCRVRRCVNPTHLEPVSVGVNTLRGDGPSARAARATHCPHGHPYDEGNTCVSSGARYCRACAREKMRRRSV